MTCGVDGRGVATHVVNSMTSVCVVVVHHITKPTVEKIESAVVGPMRFAETEVPFADESGLVSGVLEL